MSCNRIIFGLLIIASYIFAQDIDEAIRLFNAIQFDEAKVLFKEIIKNGNNPRIAEAYYYMGRLSINPDSALSYYRTVIRDCPQSRYADISYLEIVKINIARERYQDAIITLNELVRNYPDTDLKDEILFWSGISHMAIGEKEQGIKILKELITSFPKSVWSNRATNVIPTKEGIKEYFAVQVGSYRNEMNARKFADEIKKKGFDAQVVEALIKENVYYRVWVGQFSTYDEAKSFSRKLDSLDIKGNVVKGY